MKAIKIASEPRSYDALTKKDLIALGDRVADERAAFFRRNPRYAVLADRIVCVALCQGGALHVLDRVTGVKDLDVWTFLSSDDPSHSVRRVRHLHGVPLPTLRGWTGRVDVVMRFVSVRPDTDPAAFLRGHLAGGRTDSARFLARKAAVLLAPTERVGEVVWPLAAPT